LTAEDPDLDGDGLSEYGERNYWGTNATEDDSDGDGLPDGYDKLHGFMVRKYHQDFNHVESPVVWKDIDLDASGVDDSDGIKNIDEYNYRMYGARPERQDIFVEVDWMEGCKMQDLAKKKVTVPFMKHGIGLHIDDGCMGGGSKVVDNGDTKWDADSVYHWWRWDMSNNRKPLFHYCLVVPDVYDFHRNHDATGMAIMGGRKFCVQADSSNVAHVFMHELGHNLGLDADWRYPHRSDVGGDDYVGPPEYPSCMSYHKRAQDIVDYSDDPLNLGTRNVWNADPHLGAPVETELNYNDWEALDVAVPDRWLP